MRVVGLQAKEFQPGKTQFSLIEILTRNPLKKPLECVKIRRTEVKSLEISKRITSTQQHSSTLKNQAPRLDDKKNRTKSFCTRHRTLNEDTSNIGIIL